MLNASNCRGGGRLLSFIPPLSYRFDGEIHALSSTLPRANRSLAKVPAELSFTVYGVSPADHRAGGGTKREIGFGLGNGRLAGRSRRGRAVRVWEVTGKTTQDPRCLVESPNPSGEGARCAAEIGTRSGFSPDTAQAHAPSLAFPIRPIIGLLPSCRRPLGRSASLLLGCSSAPSSRSAQGCC